ncbi:MAG: hypothetical protein ABR604_00200 [Jatrophihabitantaceae bacterium]
MSRLLLAASLAAAIVGTGGCSGDSAPPALSDAAARQLQADVLVVTQSAAAHNWTLARSELQTLRTHLAAARSAGTVSLARAASIDAAIGAVSLDLAAAVPTTTPSTPRSTPAPTTAATTSAPVQKPVKKKHGH